MSEKKDKFAEFHDAGAQAQAIMATALTRVISEVLQGLPPGVQSGALAELLAIWIAGHHPDIREQMFADHVDLARRLVDVVARERGLWQGGKPS